MKISAKQYAKSLFEVVKDLDEDQAKVAVEKFTAVLVESNSVSQTNKIISYFSSFWNAEKNIIEAELISANKLDSDLVATLKEYVSKETKANEVIVSEIINKDLIGGFVLRYNDKIFDMSLKNQMREMGKALKKD